MSTDILGEWTWRAARQRLEIKADGRSGVRLMGGIWSLPDLSKLLDGFSASRLVTALSGDAASITCELQLANGMAIQLLGARMDGADARGVILPSRDSDEDEQPGPELVPYYQPIISLKTGGICGFEALARWSQTEGQGFGERLEDEGLATNMLIKACEALAVWRSVPRREDVFVQVNLTSRDLADEAIVALVMALVSGHGLPVGALRLELTEQAALRDSVHAVKVASALRRAGAALVLDDFGSGHSSFLWLADLPADSLKIDADLIARLGNPKVETILETVTLLARRLGMKTTAEGVEDLAILPRLQALGFDYAQGFALGKPMPFAAASAFLAENQA